MKKFEHLHTACQVGYDEEHIKNFEEQGWQMVCAIHAGSIREFYWKRELPQEKKEESK